MRVHSDAQTFDVSGRPVKSAGMRGRRSTDLLAAVNLASEIKHRVQPAMDAHEPRHLPDGEQRAVNVRSRAASRLMAAGNTAVRRYCL